MIQAQLGLPLIDEMGKMMIEMVGAEDGLGLDVACQTGFFTQP